MRFLLLFFIVIPLTEMMLLFTVSDQIGGMATLGLVVLTAVIGVQILKRQGLSTLLRANQRLQSGELPAQEIIEGMMLAGAGALLLTPGFITDTIGFALLTGPIRRPLARKTIRSGLVRTMGGAASTSSFGFGSTTGSRHFRADAGTTYEGEYTEGAGSISDNIGHDKDRPDSLH